ncbi:FAD binding domain-containing protein [Sarocladium implicatum]|nr:FAD binding domain-containing protein [Sarocladium implicatum]
MRFPSVSLLALAAVVVRAADEPIDAAEHVSTAQSSDSPQLFEAETVQLTNESLQSVVDAKKLNASDAALFDFEDGQIEKRGLDTRGRSSCKTSPGDILWPNKLVWTIFDLLLGGGVLEKPPPIGAVCYKDPFGVYNKDDCTEVIDNFTNSTLHINHPTSVMNPLLEGISCKPEQSPNGTCTVGGFPVYVVNARNIYHIQLAVNLARNLNIRLVIKNTGHDFAGKSTGANALSIRTHLLKDVKFYASYKDKHYQGAAFKVGSGVQAEELYAAAHAQGVDIVGGEGKTVGVAGGYILGGGHSPLSSLYGMAADQILSMELVTPQGRFVTASKDSNPDLFWALCGGGGSTYGIVTSIVVKAYPKLDKYSTAMFSFSNDETVSADNFFDAIKAYMQGAPDYTDNGEYHYWFIIPLGPGAWLFTMNAWFAPGIGKKELQGRVQPVLDKMSAAGVNATATYAEYDDFFSMWQATFPLEEVGSDNAITTSRLLPRKNFQDDKTFDDTFDVIRWTSEEIGSLVFGFTIRGSGADGVYANNGVNPAWRNASMHAMTGITWDEDISAAERSEKAAYVTNDIMGRWRDVTPGSGSYMSEGDPNEPNWQQSFFGCKYSKLYRLKQKWDPTGLLYANRAVGSEDWYIEGQDPNIAMQNGRLCKA